jgi:hypothetical protein
MNCCWVVWWFIVLDLCNSSLRIRAVKPNLLLYYILFLHFHLIKGIQYIVLAQSFLFWNLADDSILSKCTKSNTQHIAHWNNMDQFTVGEVYWEWFGDLVLRRKGGNEKLHGQMMSIFCLLSVQIFYSLHPFGEYTFYIIANMILGIIIFCP